MPLSVDERDRLTNDLLTWIEQREAEQIAYGVYDVTMTGAEVLGSYQPVDATRPPLADREDDLCTALRWLAEEVLIIRFGAEADPAAWVFRSRIAETVRLLSKLRQRLPPRYDAEQQRQRISHGKRLTGDVTFHVTPRRVPRRRRVPADYLAVLDGNPERKRCAALLHEVITTRLPKLHEISQFQEDALCEILQAIELHPMRGAERGVVVTASTGAGKTYAFFLPVLAKIILERCLRGRIGVKAICIYPRVALSENQLRDFVEATFHLNQVLAAHQLPPITLGIESGAAVYQCRDFQRVDPSRRGQLARRGWRYDEDFGGYLAPFAYCVGTPGHPCEQAPQPLGVRPSATRTLVCPACATPYPFIRFARDVMAEAPPDLLVATTESLNNRLLSAEHQYLFGTEHFCAPSVVMLDEIHLQTSTAGTQVALLLRRLLARIKLGKQERGDTANLAFVGLSATIASPRAFLAELSGIPAQNIREVQPHEDELEVIGAERYIFVRAEDSEDTAVLSTLIQTVMCVLHTMPQPPVGSPIKRYRAFGFVQSLDVVGRWLYQMRDAERMTGNAQQVRKRLRDERRPIVQRPIKSIPLYVYRYPPFNRELFPNLFGLGQAHTCGCEQGLPDRTCRYFAAGECWWVLSQKAKARREPLNIRRKSGADRDKPIEPNDDLIITTSALEVGYDDEALMCVIQYTAPSNIASFVQRKGRGGRQVGTRPIIVTVLSPYKSTDLFLFRNQHLLTAPTFRKLPLNAQNRYLQRIHGFYALFDWLAYRADAAGRTLDLAYLSASALAYLMEQTADAEVLLAFKDYLRRAFAMDAEALARVLTEESQGLLLAILAEGLVHQVHPALAAIGARPIKTRELLRKYLPENLFSDINLPEVRVDYRPHDQRDHKRLSVESISLALSETIPGNVTFRGGQGAAWVPPIPVEGGQLIALEQHYTCEELHDRARTVTLPGRVLRLLGIKSTLIRELTVLRPQTITPAQFSADHERIYWYADPDSGALREHHGQPGEIQDAKRLAHSCSAFSLSAVTLRAERERAPRAYSLGGTHPAISADPISQALVERIVLHSDEPANMNLLQVQRLILGSQYTLKSREPGFEEIGGVLGFCRSAASQGHVALGFEMLTEGLVLDVRPNVLDGLALSTGLQRRLRTSAIIHCFITALTVEYGVSYFPAVNLAHVLLTVADQRLQGDGERLAELRDWLSANTPAVTTEVENTARTVHGLSPKNTAAITALLKDDYLRCFLEIYAGAEPGGAIFQQHLRDTFQYSLAIALRQVAQEIAGVEALNYVSAWAELYVDYAGPADSIWLYEIGMGGIGVMRATHDALRHTPDRLWAELGQKLTRCPTAQEEALLRLLLTQPEDWLADCDQRVTAITGARGADERQAALDTLAAAIRRQLGVPVAPTATKALLRVFVPEYAQAIDGVPLVNWQLYREINQLFLPRCTAALGREPSIVEARALLAQIVIGEPQTPLYPELHRLAQAYRVELDAGPGNPALERELKAALENAIERRLLITCRGACPSCLDDRSGEIEAPGLARLLLSRSLLDEWVAHVRGSQTLVVGTGGALAEVSTHLRAIFERGAQMAYLRAPAAQLGALCAVVSYLTDAGVDTALGMRYPLISNVRTIYPDQPTMLPQVELTLRPIE